MIDAVPNSAAVRTQLASVMEILANAAVSEIYKVLEESCVVLRLEITRTQKENDVLRNKIQTMELHIAQLTAEKASGFICESFRAPQVRQTSKDIFSVEDQVTDIQVNNILQGFTQLEVEDTSIHPDTTKTMSPVEKGEEISVNIKEERTEMGSQELTSGQGDLDWNARNGKRSTLRIHVIHAADSEELIEGQKHKHDGRQIEGPEPVNQMEDGTKNTLQHTKPEDGMKRLVSGCMFDDVFSQLGDTGDHNEPSCSFTAEKDSKSISLHSEAQSTYTTVGFPDSSSSLLGPLDWNCGSTSVDSGAIKPDFDMHSLWNKETSSGGVHTKHKHHSEDTEELKTNIGLCPAPVQVTHRENSAELKFKSSGMRFDSHGKAFILPKNVETDLIVDKNEKQLVYNDNGFSRSEHFEMYQNVHAVEKRFTCAQCGKQFTHIQDLKGHQSVHAAEKPFGCAQCEKRFSYLHQLKTHQRVHTGEKPFSCMQCGKRFSQSSHIKRHQSVHTGEKRFSCMLCGKRFSQSCSLKVHQIVHTGERPFSCIHCGKKFSILGNLIRHQNVHIGK